jgi:hypothetical protein
MTIQLTLRAGMPPSPPPPHVDRGDGWCAQCGCAYPCPGTAEGPLPWWRRWWRTYAYGKKEACPACHGNRTVIVRQPGPRGQGITYQRRTCPHCADRTEEGLL